MTNLEVAVIPCLRDNYGFLIHDPQSGDTAVVDTPDGVLLLEEAQQRQWKITMLLNTHWHPDHIGGNAMMKKATGCAVYAPDEKIPTRDVLVKEGMRLSLGAHPIEVFHTPGHTQGHVVYFFPEDDLVFVGDTLFHCGCGRLFEGSAEDMFQSLYKLSSLPEATKVYCAHEYTLKNMAFARSCEPDNKALKKAQEEAQEQRENAIPTIPTTIGQQKRINPFMRAKTATILGTLRQKKDLF